MLLATLEAPGRTVKAVAFSHDARRLASYEVADQDESELFNTWDVATGKLLATFQKADVQGQVLAAPNTPPMGVSWTVGHGADAIELPMMSAPVVLSPDRKHLLAAAGEGGLELWSESGQSLTLLAVGSEWLMADNDGYFDASRHGGGLMAAVNGLRPFRIDQLAVLHNRPDVLLERVDLGTPELRAHYRARHERRLRQLGFSEDQLVASFDSAPRATITNLERHGKDIDLGAALAPTGAPLRSYNIYVNEVPLFGPMGKALAGARTEVREHVELTPGDNLIEVTVIDQAGAESLRAQRSVYYDGQASADLYFIGFGVSHYKDARLDLGFAHKDAADLGRYFAGARGFRHVHAQTFLDADATTANLRAAKQLLARAKVDDVVVVFVAGHGTHTHDLAADFYYATWETDVKHLRETAASFDLVEGLMQGTRSRRKLLLLDTCESGERDDDVAGAPDLPAGARGIRARTARALELVPAGTRKTPRPYLLDRERFIYNDLARRTGAVVFSSSRGDEYSYEMDSLQNGAFTHAIKQALTTPVADVDHDGVVSLDELRDYVRGAVAGLTGDHQHPTIDRDNPNVRIGLPVSAGLAFPSLSRQPHGCGCSAGAGAGGPAALAVLGLLVLAARRRR